MKALLFVILVSMYSGLSWAQSEELEGESRSSIEETSSSMSQEPKRHQFALDFFPTLMAEGVKGLGASYQYGVFSNLSIGAFTSYMETDKFDSSSNLSFEDINWTVMRTGLEAKFYFKELNRGMYLSAAATYFYLKGKGKVDSFIYGPSNSVEDEADTFGYLAKMGYVFSGNKLSNGMEFIIDIALDYGTGNAFRYSKFNSGSGAELEIDEIEAGMGLYGGLGILF